MNRFCFASPLAALAATVLLAGCASPTSSMSRIDANRPLYESWPLEVQEAVLDQRVISGMTPEMVQMAKGRPSEVTSRMTPQGLEEVWVYRARGGGPNLGGTSISVGGSMGGIGVGGTPVGGSAPAVDLDNEVVFVDGKVVRSTFPQ